jgi:hypothetical protein
MMHLKLSEKQEQVKPQSSTWKETIKTRAEINEMDMKRTMGCGSSGRVSIQQA